MNRWRNDCGRTVAVLSAALLLAGCSMTSALVRDRPAVAPEFRVDADDRVTVVVDALPDVVITADERARCAATVGERVLRAAADTLADGTSREWRLAVHIGRYDHGNAFKRSVRAGMGAMHIESRVEMFAADGSRVGEFAADRTYDWGGTLGGLATIDDLEKMLGDLIGRRIVSQERPKPVKSMR
ncbi:MAG: hypothetical protein ACOY33_01435 [Pseudomonadota bacterium]